jgi:phosphonate transport system substrate-binding protein
MGNLLISRRVVAVGLAALLAGPVVSPIAAQTPSAGEVDRPEVLRLAVTDLQGMEELQRDFEPFQQALTEALGVPVEFLPVNSRTAAAVALDSQQVDLVLTGPSEYVVLRSVTNAEPLVGVTRPGYYSVIAVHAGSGLETLDDLRGHTVSFGDIGSTSGHLGPSMIFADAGIDPTTDIEGMNLGGGQVAAFVNGDTDAIGISQDGYDNMLEAAEMTEADFPIIATGPAYPADVFMAGTHLSEEFRAELRDLMVENADLLLAAMTAPVEVHEDSGNDKYLGAELMAVEDEDYEYMREAYRAIGVDDFTAFVGEE